MATLETQHLDDIIVSTRRKMLTLGGAALAGLVFGGVKAVQAQTTPAYNDTDILNFALNLEYLESQFYTLATLGKTIDEIGVGIGAGTSPTGGGAVSTKTGGPGSCLVPWTIPAVMAYANETAVEERNHVTFLRGALSTAAVAQPALNLDTSFNMLATAAGIPTPFDPFASDSDFLVGAYIFEDVGVTAYSGAAPLITTPAYLTAAGGILAVEAYHAGLIRTTIFGLGNATLELYTQQISMTRQLLDSSPNPPVDDIGVGYQMVALEGASANLQAAQIVDAQTASPNYSKTYSRTTTQVLKIVTGTTGTNPAGTPYMGVFFPSGLNGYFV